PARRPPPAAAGIDAVAGDHDRRPRPSRDADGRGNGHAGLHWREQSPVAGESRRYPEPVDGTRRATIRTTIRTSKRTATLTTAEAWCHDCGAGSRYPCVAAGCTAPISGSGGLPADCCQYETALNALQ